MFSWKWFWVTVFIYLVMELILLLCSCSNSSAQSNDFVPCPWSVVAWLGYIFEFAECPYEKAVFKFELAIIVISFFLCFICQIGEDRLRVKYNLDCYRKIRQDLAPLKKAVAGIILGLQKGSTAYHLESVFKGKASGNDDSHAKNYFDFLTLMGEKLDGKASDVFAEKLLNVIKESKNQRSFRSQILSFWIKIYCLLDDGFIFSEKRPDPRASKIIVLGAGNSSTSTANIIPCGYLNSARKKILLTVDSLFEKNFNPGTCLSYCEQIYDNKGALWLVCQIYEWFFIHMYKNSLLCRGIYCKIKNVRIVGWVLFLLAQILLLPILFLTPSTLLISGLVYFLKPKVDNLDNLTAVMPDNSTKEV